MNKLQKTVSIATIAFATVNYMPATLSYVVYKGNKDQGISVKDSIAYGYGLSCVAIGLCKVKNSPELPS